MQSPNIRKIVSFEVNLDKLIIRDWEGLGVHWQVSFQVPLIIFLFFFFSITWEKHTTQTSVAKGKQQTNVQNENNKVPALLQLTITITIADYPKNQIQYCVHLAAE